jgi:UTP:GlnB (protein PII) uridylyltransferase
MNVTDASATTWGDGVVLESFRGTLPSPLDEERLSDALRASLDGRVGSAAIGGVRLSYDDHASPWYTLVEAHSPDRPGLLHALVTAMAAAGIEIHSARVSTIEGEAIDRFEVTDVTGRKLGAREREAAERFLETGVRLRRRTRRNATASKHSLDRVETSLS